MWQVNVFSQLFRDLQLWGEGEVEIRLFFFFFVVLFDQLFMLKKIFFKKSQNSCQILCCFEWFLVLNMCFFDVYFLTLLFISFEGNRIFKYVIFLYIWSLDFVDEVFFVDIGNGIYENKVVFVKVKQCFE